MIPKSGDWFSDKIMLQCSRTQPMILIRAPKSAMVAAIALFATIVAFGNMTDYGTNLAFVQHVLSMDTIFERSTISYRALPSPALQPFAYALIIATEALTAALCWIGAFA